MTGAVFTPTPNHLPSPGEPGPLARLRGLLEAARAVRAGGDLRPLLEAIARVISVSLGFGTVVINLHRPAWDDFEVAVVHGSEEGRRVLLGTARSWESWQALLDPRFERGGAYFIPHGEFEWETSGTLSYVPPAPFARRLPAGPDADAPAVEPLEDWHPEDALLVPMRSATGHLLGIVSVDEPIGGHRPSDAQLEVLSAVCGHAALAVEHAQATDEADHHRAAVQHLLRVSARLTGRRSVEEMLFAVGGGIRDALGFQRVIVSLTEGPDHRLRIRSSIGWSRDELAALPDVPVSAISRLLRPEHQREGCVLLAREEAEVLTPPEMHGLHRGQRNGRGPYAWREHWLLVPLHDRDGAFTGIIWVDEPDDCLLPTTEDLQALRAFANQAISAVESARQLEHLRHLAEHDPLTGLRNRRDLEPRIDEDIAASETVSVLVCDLDDFRHVSEILGPEALDDVLRRFAAVLRRATRGSDVPTRLEAGSSPSSCATPTASPPSPWPSACATPCARSSPTSRCRSRSRSGSPRPAPRRHGLGDPPRRAPRARHRPPARARPRRPVRPADAGLRRRPPRRPGRDGRAARRRDAPRGDARPARRRHRAPLADGRPARRADRPPPRLERRARRARPRRRGAARHRQARHPGRDPAEAGRPDGDEWREIRRHPELGARILEHANLGDIAGWVRAHHEWVDGRLPVRPRRRGDPGRGPRPGRRRRLRGDDGRPPVPPELGASAAEAELRRGAGSQFDADVVDAFIAALADGDDGLPSPV